MAKNGGAAPSCRICGAASGQTVRAHKVYGGEERHRFWHCAVCDAIYLHPVPSEAEERRFYRQEFDAFMADRSGDDRDWSGPEAHIRTNQDQVKRRWPFLESHLRSGMKLLEIGCSSGFMLDAFRAHGLSCAGVEPSGGFIDYLMQKGYPIYASLDEIPADHWGTFDLVVHFFVLEHIRDPFAFLKANCELLKPGGTLIAEIPCVQDPLVSLYDIPAFHEFYWSIAHHYYYSQASLIWVLNRLGMQYNVIPEQRYDLSNHITWMTDGKPGGQGRYSHVFSPELIESYKSDLKQSWHCDTLFLIAHKSLS